MAINLKLPELPKRKKSSEKAGKAPAGGISKPGKLGKLGKPGKPGKSGKSGKIGKGKLPSKNYINVLIKPKKTFSLRKSWPVLVLIALLAVAFCKFLVVDRLTAVVKETNRVSTLQAQLIDANRQINELQDLDDLYAHYTTSGMTEEELTRVDRVKAMRLIEDAFLHGNISRSWNLTGNIMTLQVNGTSLKDLNQLAAELEENGIVERCVISTANKRMAENGNVEVTFMIYLKDSWE